MRMRMRITRPPGCGKASIKSHAYAVDHGIPRGWRIRSCRLVREVCTLRLFTRKLARRWRGMRAGVPYLLPVAPGQERAADPRRAAPEPGASVPGRAREVGGAAASAERAVLGAGETSARSASFRTWTWWYATMLWSR